MSTAAIRRATLDRPQPELSGALGRFFLGALIACGLLIIFVPLLLTLYLSVFDEKLISFPPRGYTLSWYRAIVPNFGERDRDQPGTRPRGRSWAAFCWACRPGSPCRAIGSAAWA